MAKKKKAVKKLRDYEVIFKYFTSIHGEKSIMYL